jgi:hypothetical protein
MPWLFMDKAVWQKDAFAGKSTLVFMCAVHNFLFSNFCTHLFHPYYLSFRKLFLSFVYKNKQCPPGHTIFGVSVKNYSFNNYDTP